jgi:GTP cyclohydrolase I/GTP cyclohydrolase-4
MWAGVTKVEKVTAIGPPGEEQLYHAELECFVELERDGARFEAVINDVIGSVVLAPRGMKAERIAQRIAVEVRERLAARHAAVTIAARSPLDRRAPATGMATQEIYTLLGTALATERGARRVVGVAAQGMTASPDAQAALAERLAAQGFDRIDRILAAVPVATHNQRALGTLQLGLPEDADVDARDLLAIVESSMSSEIYELMKRSDESEVVEKAARRPRRADDCVRAAIYGTLERFGGLGEDAFVSARQEHFETLRGHTLVAERFGLVGELRRDDTHHTTVNEWLSAAGSDPPRTP